MNKIKRFMPYQAAMYGGTGGNYFDDMAYFQGSAADVHVNQVWVQSGSTLDRFIVNYKQGGNISQLFEHGASTTGSHHFGGFLLDVDGGERLMKLDLYIHVYQGTKELNGINFITNRRESKVYGNAEKGNEYHRVDFGGEICCFYGQEGTFLDALGVWVRPPGG